MGNSAGPANTSTPDCSEYPGRSSALCSSWTPAPFNHPVLISCVRGKAEAKSTTNPFLQAALWGFPQLSSFLCIYRRVLPSLKMDNQPPGACSAPPHLQLVAAQPLLRGPCSQASGISSPLLQPFSVSEAHQVSASSSPCSLGWVAVVPLTQSL